MHSRSNLIPASRIDDARRERGFSLIEVTIAIAITAVALVALMGMLPRGMKTMQEAGDRAIEARIHQQIVSEVQITEWEERRDFHNVIRTYDDQGIQLESEGDDATVYRARILMESGDVSLPGGLPDENLQLVIVEVSTIADPNFDFDADESQRFIRTYQSIIAKTGREFDQ